LSERRAVTLLWALAAIGGTLGIGIGQLGQKWSVLLVTSAFLIGMVLFAAYLAGIRVYDDADVRAKQGTLTPIVVDFMHKRRVAEVLLDFCLVVMCYYTAYRLRFETPAEFLQNFDMFTRSLPVIVAAQMVAFFVVGVYRGVWRHFGMMDTLVVARGVFFGLVSALLVILGVYPVLGSYSALVVLLKAAAVDAVVVSARRMPAERLNNLTVLCSENNITLSRLRVDLEPLVPAELDEPASRPHSHLHQIG